MTTATPKIPSVYKLADIGVIPADWDVKKLGELADYKNGKSFESHITDRGDYFLITLNSLDIRGELKGDHLRVAFNDKSLCKNDLIMILSDVAHGNFLGLTDVIPQDNKYVLNQRVGALKNIKYLTPYYLSKYINLRQKYFKTAGQGSSQQNLAKDDILNFGVPYPNSKTEQSAITDALSDAETLIKKLEKLIEKKQNIKQGAMQEILTGKRRLPGFSGKWEEKKVSDICVNVTTGKLNANAMVEGGEYRFYTCAEDYYQIDRYAFDTEALLVSGNGANVGYVHYYKGKFNAYQRTYVLSDFSADIQYIKLFMDRNLKERIRVEVNEGNTPYITMGTLTEMKIIVPPTKSEQTAIATILSDMDTEIKKLESQLTKYQNLKQGMMQVLLTGKIRLVTK